MHPTDPSVLDGSNGFRIDGLSNADIFGTSVANAGDVNGDGFDDIVVGAGFGDRAFLIFGAASGFAADFDLAGLDGSDGLLLAGAADGDTGYDVHAAGDVNGDGFDDILINDRGVYQSHLVFGRASGFGATLDLTALDGADGVTLDGAAFGRLAGYSVVGAGDLNGDGFADFAIGSPEADPADTGIVHVLFGKAGGFDATIDLAALDAADGFRIAGLATDDQFGFGLDGLGDVNGDGLDDLLISAQRDDTGAGFDAGAGYVVFGRTSGFALDFDVSALDGADGFRVDGAVSNDFLGRAAAAAGDINGDGLADFILASAFLGVGGQAFVVFGQSTGFPASFVVTDLDGTDGFRIDAADTSDFAGFDVAGVGDVNGDGFGDIIVGAPLGDPPGGDNGGEAYVLFGKASGFNSVFDLETLDATEGFRIDGLTSNDQLGAGSGGGGDFDGDGLSDIVVGARGAEGASSSAGEAYVFFGADSGAITHLGGSARDVLTGTAGADVMVMGQGNDAFTAGDGDDVVRAGAGVDSGTLGGGNDMGFGGTGADTIDGGTGNDILYGEAGNDRLTIGSGQDLVFGGTGDDQIFVVADEVGAGDRIVGGEGDRDILRSASGSSLDLTAADAFQGIEQVLLGSAQTVVGVDQDIRWVGSAGDDVFTLGAGADTVTSERGSDEINGGDGDDRLLGGTSDDVINGGAGVDTVQGDAGADTLNAGTGQDRLFGGTGDDTLMGGDDEDLLDGSSGMDTYNGGAGTDRLSSRLDGEQDSFLFEVGTGSDRVFRYEEDTDRIGISSAFGFADGADAIANMTSAEINGSGHAILNLNGTDVIQLINFSLINPGAVIGDLADDIFIF